MRLYLVRLALQGTPNWVLGRNLCGLVVGRARLQCWQVGDPPRFGGDHGTHPSIMILSWSDPVTYQPYPRPVLTASHTRSRTCKCNLHLGNLRPLWHHYILPRTAQDLRPPTQVSRHSKGRDWGLRDTAQNPSRLPNGPLKSWYMLSQCCKNLDKTNCVGSKQQVGGWGVGGECYEREGA